MKKRLLSMLLVLAMMVGMLATMPISIGAASNAWDGTTATSFAGGDGTEGNPYQIANGAQLALMSQKITVDKDGNYNRAHYKLTADIVLNDFAPVSEWYDNWFNDEGDYPDPTLFTPIGTWSNATSSFGGTFDGQGHTIIGAYFYAEEGDNHGLFGAIQGGAVIKNFALVNSLFGNEAGNIAAIAGTTDRECAETILIENIYIDAYVYGGGANVGGVIGNVSNKGTNSGGASYTPANLTVSNVTFAGHVQSGTDKASGIIADARNAPVTIENCLVVNAKIEAAKYASGFLSKNTSGAVTQTINNCIIVNTKVFSSNNRTFVYNSKSTSSNKPKVNNCFYMNVLDDLDAAVSLHTNATLSNVSEITDSTLLYAFYDGDKGIDWEGWIAPDKVNNKYDMIRPKGVAENYELALVDAPALPKDFENGSGTEEDPYLINNADDLALLSELSQKKFFAETYFKLTDDIVLTGENNHTPIGSWSSAFGGNFDGNGYSISGVHIKNGGDGSGFFACIQGGAVIKNLALVDAHIESTGLGAVGALVGQTNRASGDDITISNVYVEANVVAVGDEVAGIIGNLSDGYESGTVNLTNVVFNGSVKATGKYVAGIVGASRDVTVNLEDCAVYGSVESDGDYVAGLISGQSSSYSINNCLVAGSISGNSGVVAVAYSTKDADGERSITNSYYVNGIAAEGATKRSDSNDGITVLESISDLINANVIDGWTARTNDAPVPSAVSALVGNDVLLTAQLICGAAVRIDTSSAKTTGIRWTGIVTDAYLATLGDSYTIGMIIAPVDHIKGDFTIAELEKLEMDGTKYKNIVIEKISDKDGYIEFTCALGSIQEKNFGRAFAARIYVCVDGEYTYFNYNEASNARSISYVAGAAFNDYSETATEEYKYEVVTGNSVRYSPYTDTQRKLLADYMFSTDSTLAENASVRVMTFNVLSDEYGDKLPVDGRDLAVEAIINEYRPAVIGLQEFFPNWYSSLETLYADTTYKLIKTPLFQDSWLENILGTGDTYQSTIMYDSAQVTLLDHGVEAYTQTRNAKGNMIFWAKFKVNSTGEEFVVTSTHWDIDEEKYVENRQVQAEEHMAFITSFDCPVIAVGDFNAKTGNALFTDNGYEGDDSTLNSARFNAENVITDWSYYDHIFGTADVSFKAYNAIRDKVVEGASDHKPIYADIAFN